MSSDPPGRWPDSDMPPNPNPLPPPLPGGMGGPGSMPSPDGKGLKGMLADAMAKSRGQGVVQGSTLFFKNLAESVAHSNRNLKIGLSFLMAAFVVVASGLGYLVFQAFRVQEQTKVSLEDKVRTLDAETQKKLQPFLDTARQLEDRMAQLEVRQRQELDAVRLTAQQEVDAARQEIAGLRTELNEMKKQTADHRGWIDGATKSIQTNFADFTKRLQKLEAQR